MHDAGTKIKKQQEVLNILNVEAFDCRIGESEEQM
jgi:hypothetical protein